MTRTTVLEIVQDDIMPSVKDTPMEEALNIMIKGYQALCEIDDMACDLTLPNDVFADGVTDALEEYKYSCSYEEEE